MFFSCMSELFAPRNVCKIIKYIIIGSIGGPEGSTKQAYSCWFRFLLINIIMRRPRFFYNHSPWFFEGFVVWNYDCNLLEWE